MAQGLDAFRELTPEELTHLRASTIDSVLMGCLCGQLVGPDEYISVGEEDATCAKCGRVYHLAIQVKEG